MRYFGFVAAAALSLSACGGPRYTLVSPVPVKVASGGMTVAPGTGWNRAPRGRLDIAWEENWTQNGPLLDSMTFIAGLPDGQAIAKQRKKDDRKVPTFRADMSPQDLVSMVESFYRIRAGATRFNADGVTPATFLDRPALQFDYSYVGSDQASHRGRTVMAVIAGKLYLASLDGMALHYFDAALPDFVAVTRSARTG